MTALILCVIANILIAICFKLFFRNRVNSFVAIIVNYWVCLTLGSLMVGHIPILTYDLNTAWVPFGIALGLLFIVGFNITAQSVRFTGMTVTTVMMRMSLLMSAAYAIVFFGESASPFKLLGILMAGVAVFLINATPGEGNTFRPGPYVIYPVLTLLLSGCIEIILFYVQTTGLSLDADAELTTFAFSLAAVIGTFIVAGLYVSGRIKFQWKDYFWGIALGIPNFFSIYLILVMLKGGFEGSVLFPVLNISVLALTALVGLFAFREKLRTINLIGIGIAILAILSIMLF